MAADPADLAYGHALAMLGDPDAAAEVAGLALRRAGRNRALVLAHARQEAVSRAQRDEPVDIESLQTLVLDLPALAATLASTRPPEERAALDIRARVGGDRAALGQALGVSPTDAVDRCGEIAELWERTLDPALLAFSGAGDCSQLAELLRVAPRATVAQLLAAAPNVFAHTSECTNCADRLRAMAPVRSFFSDTGVRAPDAVRDAGRISRTKRPSASPVPLFAPRGPRRRVVTPLRVAATALALLGGGAALSVATRSDEAPGGALTPLAAASGLRIEAEAASGFAEGLRLRNETGRAVTYTLSSTATWLRFSPSEGRVPPGGVVPITAILSDDAPEGQPRATVTVRTAAGAALSQEFTWRVERAPELGTVVDGCAVSVTVIDDGDLAHLVLHWRDTDTHALDITRDTDGYAAELRPDNGPVTYWVTAVDTRGNAARTADQVINPGAC